MVRLNGVFISFLHEPGHQYLVNIGAVLRSGKFHDEPTSRISVYMVL
jgi:hypothetical protein